MAGRDSGKRMGHALPAALLLGGVIVLVLLTQHAIAGAIAAFVAGIWVQAMTIVLGLLGGLAGH